MKKSVMLVDDEELCHFINRRILESTQLTEQICTATNGEEALRVISAHYQSSQKIPDVIFVDINMPRMNGFEFIEKLQALSEIPHQTIQLVVLSSSNNKEDRDKANRLGIRTYVSKPLSEEVAHRILNPKCAVL